MVLKFTDIKDPDFENQICDFLNEGGFNARISDDLIEVDSASISPKGDRINLRLNLIDFDGHRILEITSKISSHPIDFEHVSLAVLRGNMACHVAKFKAIEKIGQSPKSFNLIASSHLYADQLSKEELHSMVYLFTKEVSSIKDELVEILS
jgi:hypothetical protein